MHISSPLDNRVISERMNYYSRLRKLADYMKSTPAYAMNLRQAAQIACMERTAFSKFFKKSVGINFLSFIKQWQVSVAIAEMLRSDCSLSYIAASVGFENLKTFERTFKKITGCTPSSYRKLHLAASQLSVATKTFKTKRFKKAFKGNTNSFRHPAA
jgi:AraC-like DNA-binding protein